MQKGKSHLAHNSTTQTCELTQNLNMLCAAVIIMTGVMALGCGGI